MSHRLPRKFLILLTSLLLGVGGVGLSHGHGNELKWEANGSRVSADLDGEPLPEFLARLGQATGWQVWVDPEATHAVSERFSNLPMSEALPRLLGRLNYALLPAAGDESPRLLVFQYSRAQATRKIAPRPTVRRVANELLVRFKDPEKAEALARQLGAKIVGRIEDLGIYRLRFDTAAQTDRARNALENHPDVASVENNYFVDRPRLPQSMAGVSTTPFNLKPIAPTGGPGVVVALIDTAVHLEGTGFEDFLAKSVSVAGASPSAESTPSHGTSMAEAVLSGVAQTATAGQSTVKLMSVDVYGTSPDTTTFNVAQGIIAAVEGGANVINLSLGGYSYSAYLEALIHNATAQGILFTASAGNEPVNLPVNPAAFVDVLAVTAGSPDGTIANFANYGSFVDVIGPESVRVHYQGRDWIVSGTSPAAAYVAGIAAGTSEQLGTPPIAVRATLEQTLPTPTP